eukprot:GFUD01137530.1.p1 GENE.GFUD01137530.1~~GFUD01137530.1.p1  ORF type:complete len:111 (+),score=46.76 GFUD01137530.1:99-431(+)
MGNCCGSENDDGPDPEERRRLQAEAAEMRNKDNEGRGLKDPEGAKRRMEQKEEPPWHELELKWHELERRARGGGEESQGGGNVVSVNFGGGSFDGEKSGEGEGTGGLSLF